MNRTIFCVIICCFCIFTCKPKDPKEEIKKIGIIDKPLNLSLLFRDGDGIDVYYDTIDGNVIKTLEYPYSIDIVGDSIIFTARKRQKNKSKEYRGKLTDEQHLKIKKLVSDLNQEYEIPPDSQRIGPLHGWLCILEIDNQVHYKHGACQGEGTPDFTHPAFSPMPKEILLLFDYVVHLSPIEIMGRSKKSKEPKGEIKKIGSIDKPLNLSLFFHHTNGIRMYGERINGRVFEVLLYPYSIDIVGDSIIAIARRDGHADKEYRGRLTDEQLLKIKDMVSDLNQEYKIPSIMLLDHRDWPKYWTCVLEIDNEVHYKYGACNTLSEFSPPDFPPMPKEILLLFQYIVELSPIRIMEEGTEKASWRSFRKGFG